MRALVIALLAVACTEATPPPASPGRNGIADCPMLPTKLGGNHYSCTSFEVIDNIDDEPMTLVSGANDLAGAARALGVQWAISVIRVPGAQEAVLVEYRDTPKMALDVLATTAVGAKTRVVQCHVPWFDAAARSRAETCKSMIGAVLQRPAPPGREITADCKLAVEHVMMLPGHESPYSNELRREMRELEARCTDKIASCAFAAKTYVEATLCRD
jgi:hypothetical protein